jgi:hypothetical protein
MKSLFIAFSLATALIAMPTVAQQGPAGVPGAPGLAPPPVVTPPPVVAPPAVMPPAPVSAAKCGKAGGKGCAPRKAKPASCSAAADPARCETHRKARQVCAKLPDDAHRQCLRDNLAPKR